MIACSQRYWVLVSIVLVILIYCEMFEAVYVVVKSVGEQQA